MGAHRNFYRGALRGWDAEGVKATPKARHRGAVDAEGWGLERGFPFSPVGAFLRENNVFVSISDTYKYRSVFYFVECQIIVMFQMLLCCVISFWREKSLWLNI